MWYSDVKYHIVIDWKGRNDLDLKSVMVMYFLRNGQDNDLVLATNYWRWMRCLFAKDIIWACGRKTTTLHHDGNSSRLQRNVGLRCEPNADLIRWMLVHYTIFSIISIIWKSSGIMFEMDDGTTRMMVNVEWILTIKRLIQYESRTKVQVKHCSQKVKKLKIYKADKSIYKYFKWF